MGLVEELRGFRVCIDTTPFIYYIEKQEKYLSIIKPVFVDIDAGKIDAITSTITLLEVLVHPLKTDNQPLAAKYREIEVFAQMICKPLNTIPEYRLHENPFAFPGAPGG